jgi:transcriptional regulator with XRE-family HTH domain
MGYVYSGEAPVVHRRSWSRPKQRIRQEVYMQVPDPELLREIREEKGLSQRQLATLSKCSQAAISAIETGKLKTISEDLGAHIARWLGRRPRELFDRFDDERVAALMVAHDSRAKRQRRTAVAREAETMGRRRSPGKEKAPTCSNR